MSSMFPSENASLRTVLPYPAVVVHDLAQARAALCEGLALTLLSAPGAACFAGAGWWRALIDMARAAHPHTPCQDVLDCADAPGHAMAAVRLGQAILVLDPACPAFAARRGRGGYLVVSGLSTGREDPFRCDLAAGG